MSSIASEHEEMSSVNEEIKFQGNQMSNVDVDPSSLNLLTSSNLQSIDAPSSLNFGSISSIPNQNQHHQQDPHSFKQKFISETQNMQQTAQDQQNSSKLKTLNTNRLSEIQQQIQFQRKSLVNPQHPIIEGNSSNQSMNQNAQESDQQIGSKLKQALGLGQNANNGRQSLGRRFSVVGEVFNSSAESDEKALFQDRQLNTYGNSTFNNDPDVKRQTFTGKQAMLQSLDDPVPFENDLDITFVATSNDQSGSKRNRLKSGNVQGTTNQATSKQNHGRSSPMIRDSYEKIPGLTQEQFLTTQNHLQLFKQNKDLQLSIKDLETGLEQLKLAPVTYDQIMQMDELTYQITEIEKANANIKNTLGKQQDEEIKSLVQQLQNLQIDDEQKVKFLEKAFADLNLIKDDQSEEIIGIANIARQSLDQIMIDYTHQSHVTQQSALQISNLMFLNLNLEEKLAQVTEAFSDLNLNSQNHDSEEILIQEMQETVTKQLQFTQLLDQVVQIRKLSAQTFELKFKVDIRQGLLNKQFTVDQLNKPQNNEQNSLISYQNDGFIYLILQVQQVQSKFIAKQKVQFDQTPNQQLKMFLESKGTSNSWYIQNNKYTLDEYIDQVLQVICQFEDSQYE
eukprot:403355325